VQIRRLTSDRAANSLFIYRDHSFSCSFSLFGWSHAADVIQKRRRRKEREMSDILERLAGLHKQATEDRSHYYVARCVCAAIVTITALEKRIAELEALPDASAGLIEAAELAEECASECLEDRKAPLSAYALRDFAKILRARAADRSEAE
jgi:hypothetical protein